MSRWRTVFQNDADFELALEEALGFLDHPPAPGSPDEHRMTVLLADLRAYQPRMAPVPPHDPQALRRAKLVARGEALLRRCREEGHSSSLMHAVDGAIEQLIHPR
jgi:antitoxin component HigA of HigAB toxin-antitoxin module